MEVERLPLHSNNAETNRKKGCLCDQEKCDKYLCIFTSIFVVVLIILSLYQLNNDMNKRNSTAKNRRDKNCKQTRKKREELSISASKSIKKEQVEIIVDFK